MSIHVNTTILDVISFEVNSKLKIKNLNLNSIDKIQHEVDFECSDNDDTGIGLRSPIMFEPHKGVMTFEDACNYFDNIEEIIQTNMTAVAVMCENVEFNNFPASGYDFTTMTSLMMKYLNIRTDYQKLEMEPTENKNIGMFTMCPRCFSKLSNHYLLGNKCPLCSTDIRSDDQKKSVEELHTKLLNVEKEFITEYKKYINHCTELFKKVNTNTTPSAEFVYRLVWYIAYPYYS